MAEAVEAGVGPLLEATLAPQSGLHAFNLLGNAVLAEVDEAVAAALPGAESPGLPRCRGYRAASWAVRREC